MDFFNLDGGIMKSLSKFTDCICLSLMFLVSCIPIFTIGTAMTAMYYTAHKVLRFDRGYVFRDYVSAFRDNFKQTVPVWLLTMVIGGILGFDLYVMNFYAQEGDIFGAFAVVFLVFLFVLSAWVSYLFPYMARFENTRKQSMKNAILLVVAHFPMTLLMMALAVVTLVMIYIMPLFIGILPAVYAWIQSYILERIFRRYMTEEDRLKEDERNQESRN